MSRESECQSAEAFCRDLVRQLVGDYPVRVEWSPLRARLDGSRQYQIYIDATFSLTGDETGEHISSTALVASGRTMADAINMLDQWARDPKAMTIFRDRALRGEQAERDAAKEAAELAETTAKNVVHVKSVRERTQNWLAKMVHAKVRRDGAETAPVISLPTKGDA